jgi:hypothetical protein
LINFSFENERSALATVTGIVRNIINAVHTSGKLADKAELLTTSKCARSFIVFAFSMSFLSADRTLKISDEKEGATSL